MSRARIFGLLAMGLGVLALGVWAAVGLLPEWHAAPRADPALLTRAKADIASLGAELRGGRLKLGAAVRGDEAYESAFRRLGGAAPAYLDASGGAVARVVVGTLRLPDGDTGAVRISFDSSGTTRALLWIPNDMFSASLSPPTEAALAGRGRFADRLEEKLRNGRAWAGPAASLVDRGMSVNLRPLAALPGEPQEAIERADSPRSPLIVSRTLLDPDASSRRSLGSLAQKALVGGAPRVGLFILVFGCFGLLLYRRRISARIAVPLAILAFLSMSVGGLGPDAEGGGLGVAIAWIARLVSVGFLFVLWMAAESMLRDTVPGFNTSLDAIAAGRFGPRVGRAHLAGIAAGAAIAGVKLLGSSAAAAAAGSGVRPTEASFSLPIFSGVGSPFYEGTYTTAVFVLFVALIRHVVARGRAEPLAAFVFALYTSLSIPLKPWGAAFAVSLAVAILLLLVFEKFGFAALLFAATASALFRETLAAGRHLEGSLLAFAVGSLTLAAITAVGFVSIRIPEREEEARIEAPDYVKRLESERRVKYEMDLLSRMQLALLPEKPPHVDGLDIAVKTELATEAGGDLYDFIVDGSGSLWVAAGDVSGHGYSCGLQQAMVKAALMSLAKEGRRPGEVLSEVDRVLRSGGGRLFTSLALLKLDPTRSTALFANAGHPFPLLLCDGDCKEIAVPGLPLAQGPDRTYEDHVLELPEGSLLVIASDGLYEGADRFEEPYGYDRPRQVLGSIGLHRRPARAIVEALFMDWRRHVGEGPPADDTTVLVLKRPSLFQ